MSTMEYTSSLQSMIMMEREIISPMVGRYVTTFMHTDRGSELITKVDGDMFLTEDGSEYFFINGEIVSKWEATSFIGMSKDFSNYREKHSEYVSKGGRYCVNGFPIDAIEGITRKRKRTAKHPDKRITNSDVSYFDPHF